MTPMSIMYLPLLDPKSGAPLMAQERQILASHSSVGNSSSFRTHYLATFTQQLPFPYECLEFSSSVLLRVDYLQPLLCSACDNHAAVRRVHSHAVRLPDGRIVGCLAGYSALQIEQYQAILGGEGNPQVIPPWVYGDAVWRSGGERHAGGLL